MHLRQNQQNPTPCFGGNGVLPTISDKDPTRFQQLPRGPLPWRPENQGARRGGRTCKRACFYAPSKRLLWTRHLLRTLIRRMLLHDPLRALAKEHTETWGAVQARERHINMNFLVWLALGRPWVCPRDKLRFSHSFTVETQLVPGTTWFVPGTSPVFLRDKPGSKGSRKSSCAKRLHAFLRTLSSCLQSAQQREAYFVPTKVSTVVDCFGAGPSVHASELFKDCYALLVFILNCHRRCGPPSATSQNCLKFRLLSASPRKARDNGPKEPQI